MNNNNIAADTAVGPVNLFLHSLFSQVDISVYSDGQQQYGIKPLATDYASQLYVQAYNTVQRNRKDI